MFSYELASVLGYFSIENWTGFLGDFFTWIFTLLSPWLVVLAFISLPFTWSKLATFRGLFVLSDYRSLCAVTFASLMASRATILSFIFENREATSLSSNSLAIWLNTLFDSSWLISYGLTFFLASFVFVTTFVRSLSAREANQRRKIAQKLALGLLLGLGLASIVFVGGETVVSLYKSIKWDSRFDHFLDIALFTIALFFLHIVSGSLLRPDDKPIKHKIFNSAPALMYVMLLTSWVVLLLSFVHIIFQKLQLPSLLIITFIAFFINYLVRGDYYFELKRLLDNVVSESNRNALKNRLKKSKHKREERAGENRKYEPKFDPDISVVVCSAGGGIQAAAWTARVLTGLEEQLGAEFRDQIILISGVSGGAVGNMFYLEGFPQLEAVEKSPDKLKKVSKKLVKAASEDSLDATGWGLVHADFWRFLGIGRLYLRKQFRDRGWSIEQNWKDSFIHNNGSSPTLSTWRDKVTKGEIPVPLFNATLVERGERLVISPLPKDTNGQSQKCGQPLSKRDWHSTDIYEEYGPDANLDITTSARLSATFPYVSPTCRAAVRGENKKGVSEVHVVDGGYFDNFGVFGALEWLYDQNLNARDTRKELGIDKILFLQINSFPENLVDERQEKTNNGWLTSLVGPLLTVVNVRAGAQATAANLACQAFGNEIGQDKFCYYNLYFPNNNDDEPKYDPPLSWKLTEREKNMINQGWDKWCEAKLDELKEKLTFN